MNFSVLMSLYDKEKPEFLHQCLQSLSQQTLPPNEIVIVYDGPISKSLKNIVIHWKKELPILVVEIEKNVGLGKALQFGLKYCKYELIARMDSDDICRKDRFEKQIVYFRNDDQLACLGSFIDEFEDNPCQPTSVRKVPLSDKDIRNFAKYRNPINHVTVVYRKSFVLNAGGYQHLAFMEDYYLWLRMLAKGYKFKNTDDCLVHVRAGSSMLKRRGGKEYIKSEFKLGEIKRSLGISDPVTAYAFMMTRVGLRAVSGEGRKRIYKYLRS